VLGGVDAASFPVTRISHYAEMAREARRQRRLVDGGLRLGLRGAEGFAERLVYRDFFPRGLTALDNLEAITRGERPSLLQVTARQDVWSLIDAMSCQLMTVVGDEQPPGRRECGAAALDKPLDLHDIVAD